MEEKIQKSKKYLAAITQLTWKTWGPKPKLLRWAYIGIVRPMLCYGAMIWGHRAPELQAKLKRVNRMAINTFASFPKSTPTSALEVMLDIMPLHLHCLREAMAAAVRLGRVLELDWPGTNNNKTHNRSHLRTWYDELDRCGVERVGNDACNVVSWGADFRVNEASYGGAAKHRTQSQVNIYTDGSRYADKAGAGYTIMSGGEEVLAAALSLPVMPQFFRLN